MTPSFKLRLKPKIWDRQTGVSPEDRSRRCFDVFRGDLSSFHSPNPFYNAKHKWSGCLFEWQFSKYPG